MARLIDLCELIVDCEHKTAPIQATGFPSIRTPNIGRGRLLLDGVNRVSEETYRAWTQREEPQSGDLILAREAPIGNVAIIPQGLKVCLGQRTVLIRANRAYVNPQYLTYLLLGDDIQGRIASIPNGATVHHLNMKDIRGLEMPLMPSLEVQDRIAAILSAYDDLIENNTRRIKIVKEIAATVFASAASQSPEEWETLPIREVYSGFFDGPHATPKPSGEGPVFLGIKNVTESGELGLTDIRHIAEDDFQQWTRRVMPEFGDIVFSYEATLYRYAIINRGFRGCLGRRLALIRPNPEKIDAYVLLRCLLSDEWRREVQSKVISGATVDRIPLVTFPNFMIRVPNQKLQKRIGPTIRGCEELAENCRRRNEVLRKTRDFLLPKLVSGEIPVEAAEDTAAELQEEIALHA